jgi:hypothetical protein
MLEKIQLSDSLIIGKGRDRICYEHPTAYGQCIKISKTNDKQSMREMSYFSFLKRKNTDLSKISTFLDSVETSKGLGYAFLLIRDHDGKISKTLRQRLQSKEFTTDDIRPLLSDLKKYLINNKICVKDISPSNISCQITVTGINLMIIDGVSNSNINPFTIRLDTLINAAIDKAWRGLERKLARIEKSFKKEL